MRTFGNTGRDGIIEAGGQIFNTIQSAQAINAADPFYNAILVKQQEQIRKKQQLRNMLLIGGGILVAGIIAATVISKA